MAKTHSITPTLLEVEILQEYYRHERNAILIEGFTPAEYPIALERFPVHLRKMGSILLLDFLEIMPQDLSDFRESTNGQSNLFVYNMDLFGAGIDPDLATRAMAMLRAAQNEGQMSQLMFARPSANLDYGSRKGYTYMDNHPLGNWCSFHRIEEGRLVRQSNPIRHR
jgi:hypothetical protein